MLMLSNQFFGTTGREEVPKLVAFVVVLLAVSWAAQRWIEAPAQRLGRRIARPARVGESAPVTVPVA